MISKAHFALLIWLSLSSQAQTLRKVEFYSGPIYSCGTSMSWALLLSNITKSEADCMDEQTPFVIIEEDRNELESIKTAILPQSKLLSKLKGGKSKCLNRVEIVVPEALTITLHDGLKSDLVEPWIIKQIQLQKPGREIEIKDIRWAPLNCASVSDLTLSQIELNGNNQFQFNIKLNSNGPKGRLLSIYGQFKQFDLVPVAKNWLNPNVPIRKEDLVLKKKDISFYNDMILSIDQLVGRSLSHSIQEGNVFHWRDLKTENMVERNQLVQVRYRGDNFDLSIVGQAEQSGQVGDFVKVKNIETKKIILATVKEKGIVEVE